MNLKRVTLSADGEPYRTAVLAVYHRSNSCVVTDQQLREHFSVFGAVIFYLIDIQLCIFSGVFTQRKSLFVLYGGIFLVDIREFLRY